MFSKADLHTHTTYSDGNNSVAEVLAHTAAHTDIRVLAITDHDAIRGAYEARELAGRYGLEVIIGAEVSSAEGHILALFIETLPPRGRPAAETIKQIHAQGGVAIAAHPYDAVVRSLGWYGIAERCGGPESAWPLDAIETFNAGQFTPGSNPRAADLAARLGLPAVGGSDSHHLATLGMGYTLFPGRTGAELRTAIGLGQSRAEGRGWSWAQQAEAGGLLVARGVRVLRRALGSA